MSLTLALHGQDTTAVAPTEARIIEGLTHEDGKVRAACARRIQDLAKMGNLVVAPGNVVEHGLQYWESKLPKHTYRISKEEFLKTFELEDETLDPDTRGTMFYQLDHSFLLQVTVKRRHVILADIFYRPKPMWVAPPEDYSGIWKEYYVTGQLYTEALYDQGITIGLKRIYSHDGVLAWEEEYGEDGILRLRKHYDAKGELIHVQKDKLDVVEDILED